MRVLALLVLLTIFSTASANYNCNQHNGDTAACAAHVADGCMTPDMHFCMFDVRVDGMASGDVTNFAAGRTAAMSTNAVSGCFTDTTKGAAWKYGCAATVAQMQNKLETKTFLVGSNNEAFTQCDTDALKSAATVKIMTVFQMLLINRPKILSFTNCVATCHGSWSTLTGDTWSPTLMSFKCIMEEGQDPNHTSCKEACAADDDCHEADTLINTLKDVIAQARLDGECVGLSNYQLPSRRNRLL